MGLYQLEERMHLFPCSYKFQPRNSVQHPNWKLLVIAKVRSRNPEVSVSLRLRLNLSRAQTSKGISFLTDLKARGLPVNSTSWSLHYTDTVLDVVRFI